MDTKRVCHRICVGCNMSPGTSLEDALECSGLANRKQPNTWSNLTSGVDTAAGSARQGWASLLTHRKTDFYRIQMVGIGAKALIFSCLAEVLSPSMQVTEGRQSQIPPGLLTPGA